PDLDVADAHGEVYNEEDVAVVYHWGFSTFIDGYMLYNKAMNGVYMRVGDYGEDAEASVEDSQLDANLPNNDIGKIGSIDNTITDRGAVTTGNAYVGDQLHRISEARSFD